MRKHLLFSVAAISVGFMAALLTGPRDSEAIQTVKIHVYPGVPYSLGYTVYNTCGWHISCANPNLGYDRGLDFDAAGSEATYMNTWSFSNDSSDFPRAIVYFSTEPAPSYPNCSTIRMTFRDYWSGVYQSVVYNIHTLKDPNVFTQAINAKRFDLGGVFQRRYIGSQTNDNCEILGGTHDHMWFDGLNPGVYNIFSHDFPANCGGPPAYSHYFSGAYFECYDTVPTWGNPGWPTPQNLQDWAYYTEW
jgi:hypothetical protein